MFADLRSANDPNATCTSRRGVIAGAGAMALATAALSMRRVLAQDGTPVASPASGEGERQSWLFTQTFTAGDWEPTADPASFTLRLRGGLANSVGFTDRPYRDTALLRTEELLPLVWDDPTNPPNAAIVIEDAEVQYTFLLVLDAPIYDAAGDQITYTVRVLEAYTGDGLGATVERVADGTLPQSFGAGALFIDSLGCKDSEKACRRYVPDPSCGAGYDLLEDGHLAESAQVTNTCHYSSEGCNYPCDRAYYDTWCNATFADWCYAESDLGCIFATDDEVCAFAGLRPIPAIFNLTFGW